MTEFICRGSGLVAFIQSYGSSLSMAARIERLAWLQQEFKTAGCWACPAGGIAASISEHSVTMGIGVFFVEAAAVTVVCRLMRQREECMLALEYLGLDW